MLMTTKKSIKSITKLVVLVVFVSLIVFTQLAAAGSKNLTATVTDSDSDDSPATVSWDVSTGSDFSTSTTSGDESTNLTTGSGSFSKTVTLYPIHDATYYWHAKAKDKHEAESGWTASTQFSIKGEGCTANTTAPDKIKNLSAYSYNRTVTLKWSNPKDISSLKLYRETSASFTPSDTNLIKTIAGSSTTSYTDNDLQNGATYYYAVKVFNECNKDSQSNETKATPSAGTRVEAITLVATCADKQNNLVWTNPAATAKIKLYRSDQPGQILDNVAPGLLGGARPNNDSLNEKYLIKTFEGGQDTNYSDTGLENGKLYHYIVQALSDKNKELSRSSEISSSACIPDQTPPPDPTDITITEDRTTVGLIVAWVDPPAEDLNYVNVYRSQQAEKGDEIAQVIKGAQTYTDQNIEADRTYYYSLTAVDKSGMESAGTAPIAGVAKTGEKDKIKTGGGVSGLVDDLMGDWQDNSVLVAAAQGLAPFSIVLPTLTTVGLLSAYEALKALVNGSYLYNFIRYLFLGGWWKRRKKPWGVCLSLNTQLPVSGAMAQLLTGEEGKVVDKCLTDKFGRFIFLIKKPSDYKIVVSSAGFDRFVSQIFNIENVNDTPMDMVIHLKDNKGLVRLVVGKAVSALMLLTNILNHLRLPVIIFGTVLAIYQVLIINDKVTWLILLFYIILWIVEIISKIAPRTFGVVWDNATDKPLNRAIVRFYRLINSKPALVATTVTGGDGAFKFLFEAGEYQCGVSRIGYRPYTSGGLTFRNKSLPNLNIRLEPMNSEKEEAPMPEMPPESPKPEPPQTPQPREIDNGVDLSLPK